MIPAGKLVFRNGVEKGDNMAYAVWVPLTEDGGEDWNQLVVLGSIVARTLKNEGVKEAWVEAMKKALSFAIEESTGRKAHMESFEVDRGKLN